MNVVKKLVVYIAIIVMAAIVYIAGCNMIDASMALTADSITKISSQPPFMNTIREW